MNKQYANEKTAFLSMSLFVFSLICVAIAIHISNIFQLSDVPKKIVFFILFFFGIFFSFFVTQQKFKIR